jgi:hypothetical protein
MWNLAFPGFTGTEQVPLTLESASACQQQDDQHEKNDPAETTPNCRTTQVEAAAAEKQQKDYQQNDQIHLGPPNSLRCGSIRV